MNLKLDEALKPGKMQGGMLRQERRYPTMIEAPTMQKIYEVLALVVALFFPGSFLTWMVIDKLFAKGEGPDHLMQHKSDRVHRSHVLADRSQPGA